MTPTTAPLPPLPTRILFGQWTNVYTEASTHRPVTYLFGTFEVERSSGPRPQSVTFATKNAKSGDEVPAPDFNAALLTILLATTPNPELPEHDLELKISQIAAKIGGYMVAAGHATPEGGWTIPDNKRFGGWYGYVSEPDLVDHLKRDLGDRRMWLLESQIDARTPGAKGPQVYINYRGLMPDDEQVVAYETTRATSHEDR